MTSPGDYLDDSPEPARIERQWGAIAHRLEARPSPWLRGFSLAALGCATILLLWFLRPRENGRELHLRDGSVARWIPEAVYEVTTNSREKIELSLQQGRGDFEVTHDQTRPFVVLAAGVEVRVVGTRFSVEHQADHAVLVQVREGVVEVRSPRLPELRRLTAGEALTVPPAPLAALSPSTAAPELSAQAASPSSPRSIATQVVITPDPSASAEPPSPPQGTTGGATPGDPPEDPRQLFERATTARRNGDPRGAAALYQQFLARYPKDPRAGLASFDLARLRMDALGDFAGAIPLLERAARGGAMREDALARLARAYQATGATSSCRRTKDAYLAAFPKGVHAGALSALCP